MLPLRTNYRYGRFQLPPVGVDTDHPLAFGLRGAYLWSIYTQSRYSTSIHNDAHKRGAAGTPANFQASQPTAVSSPIGFGTTFNGTNQYALISTATETDAIFGIAGNITVAALINFTTSQTSKPIVARWGTAQGYWLGVGSVANTLSFTIRVGGADKKAQTTGTYNDGKWHMVFGVFDGTNVKIIVDGIEQITGDATAGPINTTSQNVAFAAYNNGGTFYGGSIGYVCIWAFALSLLEMRELTLNPLAFMPKRRTLIPSSELEDAGAITDSLVAIAGTTIADSAAATESVLGVLSAYISETAQFAASLTGVLVTSDILTDSALIQSAVLTSVDSLLTDTANGADTLAGQLALLATAVEAVTASESTTPVMAISSVAASIAAIVDLLVPGVDVTVTDTAALAETLSAKLALYLALADSADIADTQSNQMTLFASPADTATIASSTTPLLSLIGLLSDGAEITVFLNLGDTSYVAYVMNAETGALSQYQNYPFNSIANFNGKTYAAAETGLYEIAGDTDAGDDIQAWIRYGLTDFGSDALKRMQSAALGITSDNQMVLKVLYVDGGKKRESWYLLKQQTADSFREGVVEIGQGLMSRYWGFEIHNIEGGDFTLDGIKLYPVVLTRRR